MSALSDRDQYTSTANEYKKRRQNVPMKIRRCLGFICMEKSRYREISVPADGHLALCKECRGYASYHRGRGALARDPEVRTGV